VTSFRANRKSAGHTQCTELHGIGSDQMQVKNENPVVPQCKFSALTNSQRHHGTLFDAGVSCTVSFGITDLR
jgi:hypothetical protein